MRRTSRAVPAPRWRVELLAGYWFVTTAVAAIGPLLAVAVLLVDAAAGRAGVFGSLAISPDAARTILGSIAGSLITIASLTASLTIVTLQLLSNQYTPRTVRGFLRRKVSQVVSGAFVGIFLYCLVLLIVVREPGDANEPFVPSLGVVSSVVLAAGALLLLVLFINALARTIQVSTMTSEIAAATAAVVRERATRSEPAARPAPPASRTVRAEGVGFVRSTVPAVVLRAAPPGARGLVRILVRPGDFVTSTTLLAAWSPAAGSAPWAAGEVDAAVRSAVLLGVERDLDDDPAFGVRQLADIALRALSPGINDPSTAVTCLGYLREVFEVLAVCPLLPLVEERDGLRVEAAEREFDEFADVLVEIGGYATGDLRVVETLAGVVCATADLAADAGLPRRAERLREEAALLAETAGEQRRSTRGQQRVHEITRRAGA